MVYNNNLKYVYDMFDIFPVKQENPEKWNRWLGFTQGILWACKVYTINELREMNKTSLLSSAVIMKARVGELLKALEEV